MNRIVWENKAPGEGKTGFLDIGGSRVEIASIGHGQPGPWVLLTQIPGWRAPRVFETVPEAQESAERILVSFVTALREPKPSPAEVRMAAENAHESGYPTNRFGDFLHGFQCAVNWLNGGRG